MMNASETSPGRDLMTPMQLVVIILLGFFLLRALYAGAICGPSLDEDSPSDDWQYLRGAHQTVAGDWAFADGVF